MFTFLYREFADTFLGEHWGYNGPFLLERIGTRMCGVKDTKKQTRDNCFAFEVHPQLLFHPIDSEDWWKMFAANYTDLVMRVCKDSIAVHTWNSHRHQMKNVVNEPNSAYSVLGKKYCPKTFDVGGKYF